MKNVALFRDMKSLHIDNISEAVKFYSALSLDGRLQLEYILDAVTRPQFKISRTRDYVAIDWPKCQLILSRGRSGEFSPSVTWNSQPCRAEIVEAYNCMAISVSGELVCLIPSNLIK